MGKDVIIALDFDSREKTLAFLDQFTDRKPFVKIGMELFYAEGPRNQGKGSQNLPGPQAPRHSEHGQKGDGGALGA